jgi:hypothetical protein
VFEVVVVDVVVEVFDVVVLMVVEVVFVDVLVFVDVVITVVNVVETLSVHKVKRTTVPSFSLPSERPNAHGTR